MRGCPLFGESFTGSYTVIELVIFFFSGRMHLYYFIFLGVVLDEVTSALSEESEKMLYSKLTDLGITFMSIGQRSSLKKVRKDCGVKDCVELFCVNLVPPPTPEARDG